MSELEQRARERFEKWASGECYDLRRCENQHCGARESHYREGSGANNAFKAWQESENSVVRSIISGMEERIRNLRMRASDSDNYELREVFDGAISELEAQIAGLKKKFGLEGM